MKIIELKHINHSQRYLNSLFPSASSFFIYLLLCIGCIPLILNRNENYFWIFLILYLPLLAYFLVIKPLLESKIYITKIELKKDLDELHIDFLRFNTKMQTTVKLKDLKYNTFDQIKISLADRIIFYEEENKILTQYANTNWGIDKIKKVSQELLKTGIKKPLGFNA